MTAFETDQGPEFVVVQEAPPTTVGIAVNSRGDQVTNREKYVFKFIPTQIAVVDPYVISIQAGQVEVHDLYASKSVQTIALKGVSGLSIGVFRSNLGWI